MSSSWDSLTIARDQTHHLLGDRPAYDSRFEEVLSFHAPGLSAVRDRSGAYHIDTSGRAAYRARYVRAFGFYEGRAAVRDEAGVFHILAGGSLLYEERHDWCGNFQSGRCAVRHSDGRYSHISLDGDPAYPQHYRYAGDYHDEFAAVQGDDGRHTHIDRSGNILHGRWFLDLDVFHKGYARARDESGWHHVDLQGHPIYERRFSAIEPFYNGQARVEDFDGKLLVIDEDSEVVVELRRPLTSPLDQLSGDLVGYWRTQTIRAAVELGVFEALPAQAADVDERLGLAVASERMLRALRELGLVYEKGDGIWQLTERGALLTKGHQYSMAEAAKLWGKEHYLAWMDLTDSLRLGRPSFESRYGEPFFDWLESRPSDAKNFHGALSSYARHDYASLSCEVDFSRHSTVIDAGGGHGELLFSVLRGNPSLQGTLMDRPEVIAGANVPQELATRCRALAGDLFATWSTRADAIVLARVLHDWPDDQALVILERARDALEADGRLYVIEMVLKEGVGSGGLLDLNMLVITGGRERTRAQFEDLLSAAGFRLIEKKDTASVSSVLVSEPG